MKKPARNLLLLLGITVVICGAALVAVFIFSEPWYRVDLRRAQELYYAGDIAAAEPLFTKIASHTEVIPERSRAHFFLGRIFFSRGDAAAAAGHFEKVFSESTDEMERLEGGLMLAALKYELGEMDALFDILVRLGYLKEMMDLIMMDRHLFYEDKGNLEYLTAEFFLRHEEFGLNARSVFGFAFTEKDRTFWRRQHLYRKIGERVLEGEGDMRESLGRIVEWVNLNIVVLSEDEKKEFENSPFHCIFAAHGSLREKTWALCAIMQSLGLCPAVALVGPNESPVIIMMWFLNGGKEKRSYIYDLKAGVPILVDGGKKMPSLSELLGDEPPELDAGTRENLYDYSSGDFKNACYNLFIDPHQVSVRSRFLQHRILQNRTTEPAMPAYIDIVGMMEIIARAYLHPTEARFEYPWRTKDGAEVRLWSPPFDFRKRVRNQEVLERLGAESPKLKNRKKEEIELARRGLEYSRKAFKDLAVLHSARQAMLKGQYRQALRQMKALLAPGDVSPCDSAGNPAQVSDDAEFFTGLCLYEMGEYEQVVKEMTKYSDREKPGRWVDAARYILGGSLEKLGKANEARAVFGRVKGILAGAAAYHSSPPRRGGQRPHESE